MRERLKSLSTGVAIYGAGDAAIQVVNLALLAVYVKGGFLVNEDYGALAIIGAIEAFARVLSRWGLDGAFMRYYRNRDEGLTSFASTIIWFLLGINVIVFGTAWIAAGHLGPRMFDDPSYVTPLRLMLLNTFLIALTFIPFHAMRMERRAATYSAFTFARSVGILILKIVLVIGLGYGLAGYYVADIVVTAVLVPWLWPWFKPFVRPTFSTSDLRTALRFGLPRVPHGIAQQILDGGNKLLLGSQITLGQLGVYQNAVTLGTGVKFFTSAFETAWAPFYYTTSREQGAQATFAKITTYGVAVLALLVAGTAVTAEDIVRLMLTADYLPAVPVLPVIALGMAMQGFYLLTSIGLNLTGRTEFYPVATFAAAAVGLSSGAVLMPRYGAFGAAAALLLSYVTLAGVAFWLSSRLYPIAYEWSRIARIVGGAVLAAVLTNASVPRLPAALSFVIHGVMVVGVYAAFLWATGFFRSSELAVVRELLDQARRPRRAGAKGESA